MGVLQSSIRHRLWPLIVYREGGRQKERDVSVCSAGGTAEGALAGLGDTNPASIPNSAFPFSQIPLLTEAF